MAKKLITLKISKRRWHRGDKFESEAMLLVPTTGRMCCLGFACRTLGVKASDIKGLSLPEAVQAACIPEASRGHPLFENLMVVDKATEANDRAGISDGARIRELKPILKRLGFRAVFVP